MARRGEREDRIRRQSGPSETAEEPGAQGAGEREQSPTAALAGETFLTGEPAAEDESRVDGGRLKPELEALLGEAQEPAAPENAASAAAVTLISIKQFGDIVAPGVAGVAGVACRWARVTPLESDEVGSLTLALYQLAQAYDLLGQLDPRTAAWISLGIVAGSVAANRKRLPPPEPAPAPASAANQDGSSVSGYAPAPEPAYPRAAPPLAELNEGFRA